MATFDVVNEENIGAIARELGWPDWITLSVGIEYLPCRRFVHNGHFVQFDFGLLTTDQFRTISLPIVILENCVLFHNVTRSVVSQRLLRGLAGAPVAPIQDLSLLLPNGKVNKKYELMQFNSIDMLDMKLGVDAHSVVIENDDVFQWRVRPEQHVPHSQPPDAWFLSDVFSHKSLAAMKKIHDQIYECFRAPFPVDEHESNEVRVRLETRYADLEGIRAMLREELIDYHTAHKNDDMASYGCTTDDPVTVTVFDEPALLDGQLRVKTLIEPILFRSAHRACERAKDCAQRSSNLAEAGFWIAEEIESSATCITLSAMCLEAYINGVIRERLESIWQDLEKMESRAKWLATPLMLGIAQCFDKGAPPFQEFAELVKWRNLLVHYKHKFDLPAEHDGMRVSKLHGICNAANAQRSIVSVEQMISHLCAGIGVDKPSWLSNRASWLQIPNE